MRTREEKSQIIAELTNLLKNTENIYLADIGGLNAAQTQQLRKLCFTKNVKLTVVKNTLLKKAIQNSGKNLQELLPILEGPTSIMISDTPKAPAQVIKEFRKKADKPILKGAYVMDMVVLGDHQLDFLLNLKTKNELIADVILALQSPMNQLVSTLKTNVNNIAGVLKTLAEKKSS